MHQMQLSPPWTLLGDAVLKLQQKGTHHPFLQYPGPTHHFNHKCRNFSNMPSMWCNRALQKGLSIREGQRQIRRSLTSECKEAVKDPNIVWVPSVSSVFYMFKNMFKTSATRVLSFAGSCRYRDARAAYTCL